MGGEDYISCTETLKMKKMQRMKVKCDAKRMPLEILAFIIMVIALIVIVLSLSHTLFGKAFESRGVKMYTKTLYMLEPKKGRGEKDEREIERLGFRWTLSVPVRWGRCWSRKPSIIIPNEEARE